MEKLNKLDEVVNVIKESKEYNIYQWSVRKCKSRKENWTDTRSE